MSLAARDEALREAMDDPACDPERLRRTLARFPIVNTAVARWGRVYARLVRLALAGAAGPVRILDIGCGGGDVLRRLVARARRDGIADEDASARVDCADGRTLEARAVVVAAGGSGRILAAALGEPARRARRDRYLMADLDGPAPGADDEAVIALSAAGVVESLPLAGGGRRLVAWDGSGRGDGEEVARLAAAVAERAGEARLAERIAEATRFEIRRVLLPRLRRGRVIAIGDAAHEISPIGGQGMNLGLLDAATLAGPLAAWIRRGDEAPLARWERDRLASARTAARLADLNTAIGRGRSRAAHALVACGIGAAGATPLVRAAARAYAMGFDRSGRQLSAMMPTFSVAAKTSHAR